ncbi:MAG: sortase, partial [Caldilineaceae bacterium]|nr:sortase [Caldilineaceae bacterium]
TPVPSPTPTMPPPTGVPTTGADLSWMEQGKWTDPPIVVKKAAIANAVAQGQPTFLQIPSLQLTTAVEGMGWDRAIGPDGNLYSQWDDIHFAAGWLKNSAVPGSDGNVVLTGHNNVFGAVFRDLWRVKAGEPIIVHADGERFVYVVDNVIVRPEWNASAAQRAETASYITQTTDQRLTLVSCWPPNSNTHRVFVEAHLVPYEEVPLQMPLQWQSGKPALTQ